MELGAKFVVACGHLVGLPLSFKVVTACSKLRKILLGFSGTETEREQRIGAKKGYYERKDNGEEDQKDLRNLPRLMRESTCSARDSKSRLTKKTSDSDRQVSHVSFLTTVP